MAVDADEVRRAPAGVEQGGAVAGPAPARPTEDVYAELSALNNELSNVTRELHRSKAELERLNRDLERRVDERTAELRRTVGRLEREIEVRAQTEAALRANREQLAAQAVALEDKNTALRELLGELGREKERHLADLAANVDRLLLPLVARLKERAGQTERGYLAVLEENVQLLMAPFARRLDRALRALTPRELEIANLLRSGLATKEIAALTHLSEETVHTHRRAIRRKLGLAGVQQNLTTWLRSLGDESSE